VLSRRLHVVTGGDARSATSIIDHIETTTTPSTTAADGKQATITVHDPAREKIDTSFENAKEAYTSKTNFELLRGYTVFQLCSVKVFVNKNKQV